MIFNNKKIERFTDKLFAAGDGGGDGGGGAFGGPEDAGVGPDPDPEDGGGFSFGGPGAGPGGASGPGPAGGGYEPANVAAAMEAAQKSAPSMGQHAVDTLAGVQDALGFGALSGWQSQGISASDMASGYNNGSMSDGFMDALDASARAGISMGITSPEFAKDIGTISSEDRFKGFLNKNLSSIPSGAVSFMGSLVPGTEIAVYSGAALGALANAMGISGANAVSGQDTGPGADLGPGLLSTPPQTIAQKTKENLGIPDNNSLDLTDILTADYPYQAALNHLIKRGLLS